MNQVTVRIGMVSSANQSEREVRVYFPADDMISGWLKVLKNTPTDSGTMAWLPKIGDNVVCLYEAGFNGNGYVLGAL